MSRRFLRALALSVVSALGLTLGVAEVAHADPVVIYQYDDERLSFTVTQDGLEISIAAANLGEEIEHLGLGATLADPNVVEPLWVNFGEDVAAATLEPGQNITVGAYTWPGTTGVLYRNIDTVPEEVTRFTLPGQHTRLVFTVDPYFVEIGASASWATQPVVTGGGLLISADHLPPGPIEAFIDPGPSFEVTHEAVVLTPTGSQVSLGTGVVDGSGHLVMVGEVPGTVAAVDYDVYFGNGSGPLPHFSETRLSVVGGSPAPGIEGTVAITGDAKVGLTVAADAAGWDPAATLLYQWFASGIPIVGANASSLAVTASQLGATLTVEVTAWCAGCTRTAATSAATAVVTSANSFTATTTPVITGTPAVGQKLVASVAAWTPGATFAYQWRADGAPIGTGVKNYVLTAAEVGKSIDVVVTGTRAGFIPVSVASAATAPVTVGQFVAPVGRPSVTGTAKVGRPLTVQFGTWKPAPAFSVQWTVNGVDIAGATATTFTVPGSIEGVSTIGSTIGVRVAASLDGYDSVVRTADATAPVIPGVFNPKGVPAILGTLAVGETLTADPGLWDPNAVLSYEWTIVNVGVASTDSAFVIPVEAQNHKIRLTITASADGYTSVVKSVTTTKVP